MKNPLDDGGRTVYRLVKLLDPPAFVKAATDLSFRPTADAFADPSSLTYPCHTAALTWLSAASYFMDGEKSANVTDRLTRFAGIHQIEDEIFALEKKVAELKATPPEEQLPDDVFAFVEDGVRHLPMRNPEETRKAAAYLVQRRSEIPFPIRTKMAARVLARAEAGDVALGNHARDLAKMAGYGGAPAKLVAEKLEQRAMASRVNGSPLNDEQLSLTKLAHAISADPELLRRPGFATGVATAVDAFDRKHALTNTFEPVEETVFAVTPADIEKYAQHCQANGYPTLGPDETFDAGRTDYLYALASD